MLSKLTNPQILEGIEDAYRHEYKDMLMQRLDSETAVGFAFAEGANFGIQQARLHANVTEGMLRGALRGGILGLTLVAAILGWCCVRGQTTVTLVGAAVLVGTLAFCAVVGAYFGKD